jgi:replicative DNA helicase
MLAPDECIPIAVERLGETGDAFYDLRHQTIYTTILELWSTQVPVDVITLQERLGTWGTLEQVGGLSYLSGLPDTVPSAANLPYYLDILLDKANLRGLIRISTEAVARAFEHQGDSDELLDDVESQIMAASERRLRRPTPDTGELVRQAMQNVEARLLAGGAPTGIATGLIDFDRMTRGLHPAQLVLIAARPSQGKTALALRTVETACLDNHIPTAFFSLETTGPSIIERMIAIRARTSTRAWPMGNDEMRLIMRAAQQVAAAPLYVEDSYSTSIIELRAKARRMQQRHGIRLIVVDYLQLIHGGKKRYGNRQEEIADISRGLKELAKELSLPIIVVAQLNRDLEQDKGRKPRLSDLRESGQLEQDADIVAMLCRLPDTRADGAPEPAEGNTMDPATLVWNMNLGVVKQKDGPTGDVPLVFHRSCTRFDNAARVEDDEPQGAVQQEFAG